jgi:transposase
VSQRQPALERTEGAGIPRPAQQRLALASAEPRTRQEELGRYPNNLRPACLAQHTAWQVLKGTPSAHAYLEELYRCSPEIARLAHRGKEFFRIVRTRDITAWTQWLEAARNTALRGFASGLMRDRNAVQAALSLP